MHPTTGPLSERDWKKGKHVTIQEDEERNCDVHKVQYYEVMGEIPIVEIVNVVTTRSKQPLVKEIQQNESSDDRFNVQHSSGVTSSFEFA